MIQVEPIAYVESGRTEATDDFWGNTRACIILTNAMGPEALDGIEEFSHAEILFFFDRVEPGAIILGARHPRNNPAWPKVGIFAQRGKNRPNRIGSSIVRIWKRDGQKLYVSELDAVDGTPVLDIKPVMQEFLPRETVHQPAWSHELMRHYWVRPEERKK